MKKLNFELKNLCQRNRDGSYQTQTDRHVTLQMMANQLPKLGYQRLSARSLKPKHVQALVDHWQAENLSISTLKNRMSVLEHFDLLWIEYFCS